MLSIHRLSPQSLLESGNATLRAVALSAALLAGGCATVAEIPEVNPEVATQPESPLAAYALWGDVLRRHVDEKGRIDYVDLIRERESLDRFVAWVYTVSPETNPELFPSRADKLAYHINAYNVLALYNVIDSQSAEGFESIYARHKFFYRRKVTVGGRKLSLSAYEEDVIRPLDEERVHFALNCMVRSCPRLPNKPYLPATLFRQLEDATRLFVSEPRNVYVDYEKKAVFLSEIFKSYRSEFLSRAPSLSAYVNLYRSQPVPEDFKQRFIDYDWRLNRSR